MQGWNRFSAAHQLRGMRTQSTSRSRRKYRNPKFGEARKIIVEVIEAQKQLKKDFKSAGYLLECCAKAQAFLLRRSRMDLDQNRN